MPDSERLRLVLVASSGGHLAHLLWLRPWWELHERRWVTFRTPDAVEALAGEEVTWAHHPTNRHLGNLARNAIQAARSLAEAPADCVVSAGAGVALPWLAVARATGTATVHLEVYDRVDAPSLTTRWAARIVDRLVLQWPQQRAALGRGVVLGPIR
jgi:UDP-N-acetylglucosamine:LPS N-acetylglucosamine transferase